MPGFPWRRGRTDRAPDLTGVWSQAATTSATVQRRTVALGTPAGEVGALLSRAVAAGASVRSGVDALCAEGSASWPDADLQVPSDARGRALHDRVRGLVAAQRAVLHRATLLTMPADAVEQDVLLAGLRRAVGELAAAGERAASERAAAAAERAAAARPSSARPTGVRPPAS